MLPVLNDAHLRLLHPSQQLVDEPQAPFVLRRGHGHQLGASHRSPQQSGARSAHRSQQRLSQREASVGGSEAAALRPAAAQSLGEAAPPVDAGALQPEGDQLLLKARNSAEHKQKPGSATGTEQLLLSGGNFLPS